MELKVVPLTKEYWDRVVSHTIKEIERGRTPNPDILCNSRVKFGAFYDHLSVRSPALSTGLEAPTTVTGVEVLTGWIGGQRGPEPCA